LNELLWIDGISISQLDEDEKAGQAKMMGEVYKKAKAVRVWAGPFGEKAELGMDLLAEAEDFVRTHGDGEYFVDGQMRRPLQHWVHDRIDVPELAEHWESFFSICERPYWMRCWIILEIVLSAAPILFCGERKFSLETLFEISNESLPLSFETVLVSRIMSSRINRTIKVFRLFGTRAFYLSSPGKRQGLDSLVWDFKSSRCAVPRDRF
jgi:hypothetical protein